MTDDTDARTGRGQTLPDFVVGIAIFLLAITFIVQIIPQLIVPYEAQEQPVVVQRAASDLENRLLAGEAPSQLNETCTLNFFAQNATGTCPFDTDEPVTEQLGVGSRYSVNVTLRSTPSDDPSSALLCDVGGTVEACDPSSPRLQVGPPVPQSDESVATARRRIVVGDTEGVLEIGVW